MMHRSICTINSSWQFCGWSVYIYIYTYVYIHIYILRKYSLLLTKLLKLVSTRLMVRAICSLAPHERPSACFFAACPASKPGSRISTQAHIFRKPANASEQCRRLQLTESLGRIFCSVNEWRNVNAIHTVPALYFMMAPRTFSSTTRPGSCSHLNYTSESLYLSTSQRSCVSKINFLSTICQVISFW